MLPLPISVRSHGAELTIVKAAHTRWADVSAQAVEDANKARAELRDLQVHFIEAVREAKVANKSLAEVWQQSVKSAEDAEDALHQLTELLSRAQALEAKG